MEPKDLKGKKITVMGLGLHGGGIGTVRFLHELGARLVVTDLKSKEELAGSLKKLEDLKDITYVLSQHRPEDFSAVDMVVKNPGVSKNNKYVQLALKNNVAVEMDSSLFFSLAGCPIIGVTGTKGKTTTASLIAAILRLAKRDVLEVGIGQTSVLDKIKEVKDESTAVFELSSWRLAALREKKKSPSLAVITNIFPDHLNYYKGMEDYIADKKNIFLFQKKENFLILNGDNHFCREMEKEACSRVIKFSRKRISGSEGVYPDGDWIYCNNGIDEKKILEISGIKIPGEHNLENVLAATAAALAWGIDPVVIKEAVGKFGGVSHRLELVREWEKIRYYNDTAATTPQSAVAALNSFNEKIILICGGSEKNLDSRSLAEEIVRRAKAVVFLKGEATEKLIKQIEEISPEFLKGKSRSAESMEEAVFFARQNAQAGEIVLLSPGAASFGMFLNEFDRGNRFKKAVSGLK